MLIYFTGSKLLENEKKHIKALEAPNYQRIRKFRVVNRVEGPFYLVLEDQELVDWQNAIDSTVMLITGLPGQGKTVLSKSIITHLEKTITPFTADKANAYDVQQRENKVVYFFFYEPDKGFRTLSSLLRSLIVQLLENSPASIWKHITSFYVSKRNNFEFDGSDEDLLDIFKAIISDPHFGTIYCVVDALDECENDDSSSRSRDEFLEFVYQLCDKSESTSDHDDTYRPILKFFITSRPIKSVLDMLGNAPFCKHIHLKVRSDDLKEYISQRVGSLSSVFTKEMRQTAEDEIIRKSGDTFLWTAIILKEIIKLHLPTSSEIRELIRGLPRKLGELYDELLKRVLSEKGIRKEIVQALFIWVCYARYPLNLEELNFALFLNSKSSLDNVALLTDMPNLSTAAIGYLGGSLLEVSHDNRVMFIHQSVKEFMVNSDALRIQGLLRPESLIGKSCMRHLISGLGKRFKYPCSYWFYHIQHDDISSMIDTRSTSWFEFLKPTSSTGGLKNGNFTFTIIHGRKDLGKTRIDELPPVYTPISVIEDADVTVLGEMNVTEAELVCGGLAVKGKMNVTGAVCVTENLTVYGEMNVTGAVFVYGDLVVYGEMNVTGVVRVHGNLRVFGPMTVTKVIYVGGVLEVRGYLHAIGALFVGGALGVVDELLVIGWLYVVGKLRVLGQRQFWRCYSLVFKDHGELIDYTSNELPCRIRMVNQGKPINHQFLH